MRRQLVITDLTRMQAGRVCLAGYPIDGEEDADRCVRPEFRFGAPTEVWLAARGGTIRPFAVVELDVQEARSNPPHTEGRIVDKRHRVWRGALSDDQRFCLLARLNDGAVDRIFGAPVHEAHGWFVRAGEGDRSLGTVRAADLLAVTYHVRPERGTWAYRLTFDDATGRRYNLAVTDLAYRYFLDSLREEAGMASPAVAERVLATLREAVSVYLRVGLARGWGDEGDRRCHLQINGVYTAPDYLDGRCFADFRQSALAPLDLSGVPF